MPTVQPGQKPWRCRLESFIRVLVWSTLLSLIAMPLLLTAFVSNHLFGVFSFDRREETFRRVSHLVFGEQTNSSQPKAVTSLLGQERAKQIEKLTALSAAPEMASGAVDEIQFVATEFENIKPASAEHLGIARERVYADGYRQMTLDMAGLSRQAVVLVSQQPIRWTIVGLQPRSRPVLGFEGYAAFDIVDGRPGSLAGFRIGVFGSTGFIHETNPERGDISNRDTFCSSVQKWVDHFGITLDRARFTVLLNPTSIAPRLGAPLSDGEIAATRFGSEIQYLCERNPQKRRKQR
jgi:hypothetical protein